MPRNVRNFWIETRVDGKSTVDATGPRAADGGFTQTIKMRNADGGIMEPLLIRGWVGNGGKIYLDVEADGQLVHRIESRR